MSKRESPSIDLWLREAKAHVNAGDIGMFLVHNGVVRQSPRAKVRFGKDDVADVKGMRFSYDAEKVTAAVAEAEKLEGIGYVRVWLNEGELELGDDIMYVLVGGDIRPNVIDALQKLVGTIKTECVNEQELY